jgi:hypothetical protein
MFLLERSEILTLSGQDLSWNQPPVESVVYGSRASSFTFKAYNNPSSSSCVVPTESEALYQIYYETWMNTMCLESCPDSVSARTGWCVCVSDENENKMSRL